MDEATPVCDVCGRAECGVGLHGGQWNTLADEVKHWRLGYERERARADEATAAWREATTALSFVSGALVDAGLAVGLASEFGALVRGLAAERDALVRERDSLRARLTVSLTDASAARGAPIAAPLADYLASRGAGNGSWSTDEGRAYLFGLRDAPATEGVPTAPAQPPEGEP